MKLGHRVYRRTVAFLIEMARRELMPQLSWRPGPSWGGAYDFLTETGKPLDETSTQTLVERVLTWASEAHDLIPRKLPWVRAVEALDPEHDADGLLLLKQRNPAEVTCVFWQGHWVWTPEVLLPSTKPVSILSIKPAEHGFVVGFPQKNWPLKAADWSPSTRRVAAHMSHLSWSKAQGSGSIARVNAFCTDPLQASLFIQGAEAVHERGFAELADQIVNRKAHIVLIAGPSSSGKTTSAKRLAVQLQAIGKIPFAISLDDYFVDREATPKDSQGRLDFEALEAIDLPRLDSDLQRLLHRETVTLPLYDFKSGTRKTQGRPFQLGDNAVLILEGIHALNPRLWTGSQSQETFKIYISAMTPLSWDGTRRFSTSDLRLVRRLVRDHQYRGYSALATLRQWSAVRQGENLHIFPYQERADGLFNSSLPYEIHALRELALPLLEEVSPLEPEYAHARDLRTFLEGATPLPIRLVPPFSLLREFVGQSGFHY